MKKLAMFAAGVLFGTAGIKLLSSKDAKKAYTHTTAAVLRAKDSVMKTVTTARENVEDIYSDAKAINEQRAEDEAAAVPEEHKSGIDMGRDLLRRSHVLVVCGHTVTEAMKNDIAVAQRLGITATTLEGILTVKGQGRR